jgi:isoaspartyl peptidase/L-asparaginase-like protein (Ntn-hydrolase superfamily)
MYQVGAVSSTGHGESITKTCLAFAAIQHMLSGLSYKVNSYSALILYS